MVGDTMRPELVGWSRFGDKGQVDGGRRWSAAGGERLVVVDDDDEVMSGGEEPKKVIQALKDPNWIEAMQETLMDFPNGKRTIGIKWVYRNKKDERAIRLFLAYASFKDFMVYQMDVKSAFLYEKIEEEVYTKIHIDNESTICIVKNPEILKKFGFSDVKTGKRQDP
ncbi:putative ribonuclease H-like domain-containing protein [Tanacetum coccineum]